MYPSKLLFGLMVCAVGLAGCSSPLAAPQAVAAGVTPFPTPESTITANLSVEKQAAVATAQRALGSQIENLRLERVTISDEPQRLQRRVLYQQVYQSLPVMNRGANVIIEADGRVEVWGNYDSSVKLPTIIPAVTLDDAISRAAQSLGAHTQLKGTPRGELVVYPYAIPGQKLDLYLLVWQTVILTDCPMGEWYIWINAADGSLLGQNNVMESKKPWESACPTPLPLPTMTYQPSLASPVQSTTGNAYPPPPPTSLPTAYP